MIRGLIVKAFKSKKYSLSINIILNFNYTGSELVTSASFTKPKWKLK